MSTTTNSISIKTMLAVGIVIVGIVVAWRGLNRSLPASRPATSFNDSSTAPSDIETAPGYIPSALMTFEVKPTDETLSAVVAKAGERLVEVAQETLSGAEAINPGRLEALRARFERHFAIILSGSYEDWLAQIDEFGGHFDAPAGEDGGPLLKEQWEKQAEAFRMAPLSLGDLTVRPLYLRGEKIEYPMPVVWGHALYRGPYGAPNDPAATNVNVYEILLPMLMHVGGDAHDKKLNVGFSYFWSSDRFLWIPFEMQFYTDDGGRYRMFPF